ncbi:MAG TPA: hypothetical protein VFG65_08750 [Fimbriimonadales bacterium]|jgi:hypothetical protein|nr:hypothetical protein [Fimbriimonadales bacterium]
MKKTLGFLLMALAIPAIADDFIDGIMDRYKLSWRDAALVGGLSRDFHLDPSVVVDTRSRFGMRGDDLISALYFRKSGKMDEVFRLRGEGYGWGEIAHKLGMNPGEFNKMRKNWDSVSDSDFADALWRDRLKKVSRKDLDWARSKNLPWADIYTADKAARDRHRSFRDMVDNLRNSDYGRVGGAWDPRYDTRNPFGNHKQRPRSRTSSKGKVFDPTAKGSESKSKSRSKDTKSKNKDKKKGGG